MNKNKNNIRLHKLYRKANILTGHRMDYKLTEAQKKIRELYSHCETSIHTGMYEEEVDLMVEDAIKIYFDIREAADSLYEASMYGLSHLYLKFFDKSFGIEMNKIHWNIYNDITIINQIRNIITKRLMGSGERGRADSRKETILYNGKAMKEIMEKLLIIGNDINKIRAGCNTSLSEEESEEE